MTLSLMGTKHFVFQLCYVDISAKCISRYWNYRGCCCALKGPLTSSQWAENRALCILTSIWKWPHKKRKRWSWINLMETVTIRSWVHLVISVVKCFVDMNQRIGFIKLDRQKFTYYFSIFSMSKVKESNFISSYLHPCYLLIHIFCKFQLIFSYQAEYLMLPKHLVYKWNI